jgi:dTDP-4-amino-4,6-dideoxygalactose transaminase
MLKMKIPFSPPYIDEDIISEVSESLRSGWITTGPRTKNFEKILAEYCGTEKVLCVNSATAGLELVLRWFGIGEGDEVIIPAYTYSATASVVLHCGAIPVMVDTDLNFQMDVKHLEKAINAKTKAVIPVDIFGLPMDYDKIKDILISSSNIFNPKNEIQKTLGRILFLVDSAHSIGAEYKGKKVGSQADAMVFSFHAVKNLTTAEGGAIAFNPGNRFRSEDIYQQLNIKSLHGQTKDALSKLQKGGWQYDIIEAGYKFNMPDVLAAIGLASFKKYENFILPRRREIFNAYSDAFSKNKKFIIPIDQDDNRKSSCHVYPLRIKNINVEKRNLLIEKLEESGINVNVHYQPLPLLSLYKNLGYNISQYPVSFYNYEQEISLPVYPQLTSEQMDYIISTVNEITNKYVA